MRHPAIDNNFPALAAAALFLALLAAPATLADGAESGPSPPAAPRDLDALTGPGPGEITLAWRAPADDSGAHVILYSVYRGAHPGTMSFYRDVIVLPDFDAFIDHDAPVTVPTYYRVTATNGVGEGPGATDAGVALAPPLTISSGLGCGWQSASSVPLVRSC